MRRTETPKPIWIKFCMLVDITDIVTYTNFGDHQLRGFWVAGGQIFPFPIDFDRRPYKTLALPCECVMKFNVSKIWGSLQTFLFVSSIVYMTLKKIGACHSFEIQDGGYQGL